MTDEEKRKIAAKIAHDVLDYLNSTPAEEPEDEPDDWCAVRDIALKALAVTKRGD